MTGIEAPATMTIAIVEDSAEDRMLYQRFLRQDRQHTYQIREFTSGLEALIWCLHNQPDLILLDFMLPDLDGLEFLQKIRQQVSASQTSVVMLTGQGDAAIAVQTMQLGAQDYRTKSELTHNSFHRLIHHVLERMHLVRQLEQSQEQQRLLSAIALRIRQSLKLDEVLQTTAAEVRQFLKVDRVVVYQFNPDMSGNVVAESVLPGWTVALGSQIEDTCFQQGTGADYRQGRKRAIDNIYQAGLSDCHGQLLEQFEVKANLVVPILINQQLWGLLIAHQCSAPRLWQSIELELLDQLGVHVAIAILQANTYEQAQAEILERRRAEDALKQLNQELEARVERRTAALQASEERWQLVIKGNKDGIFDVNLQTNQVFLSSTWKAMLGYQDDEIGTTNTEWSSRIHPDDYTRVMAVNQAYLAQEIPLYSVECRLRCKDGSYKWVMFRGQALWDDQGTPLRLVGSASDISDRKRLEQEQSRLVAILEASTDYISMIAPQERLLWNNAQLKRLRGLPTDADVAQFQLTDYHPQWAIEVLQTQGIPAAIQQGIWMGETALLDHMKQEVPVSQLIVAHRSADGQIEYFSTIMRDISVAKRTEADRNRAEAALRASEQRYRILTEAVPNMIWIADAQGLSYGFNQQCETYLGIPAEQFQGHGWEKIIHPDDVKLAFAHWQECIQTNTVFDLEYRLRRADGVYRWHVVRGLPVLDPQNQATVWIGSCTDIDDFKQAEKVLRLQAEQERLIGAIIQRIRESLDLDAILNTTVAEIQHVLQADRVLVYRINPNGDRVTVAESVADDWSRLLHGVFSQETFPKFDEQHYNRGQVLILTDRTDDRITPDIANFLKGRQIRAKLGVPILQNGALWGILVAHQCAQPRDWQDWEIQLLQQLADQLAIAIQQSELYHQLQVQLGDRQQAEARIQASLNEKELLLKEIHHRVKNNLQVISSIFSLQSNYTDDANVLMMLADSQNRIRSMALIHEKLYQSSNFAKIDFADYIKTFVNDLFASYSINKRQIQLNLTVHQVALTLDAAIPCGLLINELISNSLKHAFPNRRPGELTIELLVNTTKDLQLTVKDNGIGLPANLTVQKTNSLGLSLIYALTRQLEGSLEIHNDNGACFQITFPQPKDRKR